MERESRTPFTVVNILGLDNFEILVLAALLGMGDQLGPVTDHVFGQFIDLVSDFTNAINALFLGLPEIVRDSSFFDHP